MFSALVAPYMSKAAADAEAMHVHPWEWGAIAVIVIALITLDLLGHVRKAHEPTIREAARWTAFYVSLAIVFGVVMVFRHSPEFASEFFAGYITEYSLSIDNIFVFVIVIASFKVPRLYQQKVLMYGIMTALILRLIFILVGATLIERFSWVFFLFGAFLLYTAIAQLKTGAEEEEEEYKPNAIVRAASRMFNVTDGFVGDRLVTRRSGKTFITPLLLCIVAIGTVDLMFALDSIPAIFGLTKEPFIVFSANAFALLGLRQLFFLVDGLLDRLVFLNYGLAAILGFISIKLILHAFHTSTPYLHNIPEPNIAVSLGFIVVTILLTVIFSLMKAKSIAALEAAEAQLEEVAAPEESEGDK